MSDEKTQNDTFKKLFLKLSIEDKKALNDWCVKEHELTLPVWFSHHAESDAKQKLIANMENGDLSGYGIAIVMASKEEDTHNNEVEEEEDTQRISPNLFDKKLSDDDLKHLLENAGYKPELKPNYCEAVVNIQSVRVRYPSDLVSNPNAIHDYIADLINGTLTTNTDASGQHIEFLMEGLDGDA
jgi:hypothetical protein